MTGRPAPDRAALRAVRDVVSMIADGGLGDGDRLPPVRELQTALGVGRATLREALRFLEHQGVVELLRGRHGGPVVRVPDEQAVGAQLGLLLHASRSSLHSMLEARAVVEPLVTRLAATAASGDDLAELERLVDGPAAAPDPLAAMMRAREFHHVIGRASGNVLLECVSRSFDVVVDATTTVGLDYSRERVAQIVADHRLVLDALRVGDGACASAVMARHLGDFATFVGDEDRSAGVSPLPDDDPS